MRKLLLAGAAAATMTLGGAANAAVVDSTPPGNSVIGAVDGWFDADVYLFASGATAIDVWFVGIEAGDRNSFTISGVAPTPGPVTIGPLSGPTGPFLSTLFGGSVVPTKSGTVTADPGLLDFRFLTTEPGPGSVINGANRPELSPPNFFATFGTCTEGAGPPATLSCTFDTTIGGGTPSGGRAVLLALDDGGAGTGLSRRAGHGASRPRLRLAAACEKGLTDTLLISMGRPSEGAAPFSCRGAEPQRAASSSGARIRKNSLSAARSSARPDEKGRLLSMLTRMWVASTATTPSMVKNGMV